MSIITLISPSKSLEYKPVPEWVKPTDPVFLDEASVLVAALNGLGPKLAKTLRVSDKIAELNKGRYATWSIATHKQGQPAIYGYSGDVYNGLQAGRLDKGDLEYAQQHLRIVSGLYGLLRPLDHIEPYRLEMGTKLKGGWGMDLYSFWADKLARQTESLQPRVVLNCASLEYSKSVLAELDTSIRVVSPIFLHTATLEEPKQKALFSKYARGLMAHWIIKNRIEDPRDVPKFCVEGYTYDHERSGENEPVFIAPKDFSLLGRFVKNNWRNTV